MKILHADSGREMRGGQWQVLSLHQGLGANSMLLCQPDSPLMRECRQRGLHTEALSIPALRSLSRAVDFTHVHDARTHTWAAAISSAPVIVSRRVAFPIGRSWLSRWKYARATHYIAVSDYVRSILCDGGIPAVKISVVYDGVDLPKSVAHGDGILAMATDDPMKGTALLREAAAEAGLTVRYSNNLIPDLKQAAIFLYITHSEGLGSAALLAMAAGVPVVASNVGGLPEIVENDVTGVLTENNATAIANAIRHALARRAILAENARKTVEQRFTTSTMLKNTMRVYERVLLC
jgi:hypothetical protein